MRILSFGLCLLLSAGCVTRIRPPVVEAPKGQVPVEFVSGYVGREWDVYVGAQQVCTTPCKGFVEPWRPIVLRSYGDRVQLSSGVAEYRDVGPVRVRAIGEDGGARAGGITFTALGGMGVVTGGFLALAGTLAERPGLAEAGLYTAVGSGALLAAGLAVLLNSGPHAEFYAFDGERPVRLLFGPGSVKGEF